MNWVYSWFNKRKYLSPITDKFPVVADQEAQAPEQKSYAVIYGASNKAGKSFAYYLMSKGFNLILINREMESIQILEDQLRKVLPLLNPTIIRIVIDKFD